MARSRRSPAAPKPSASVRAVYSPPGGVKRHHVRNAPSGQYYRVPYQEPFEIKVEDVKWFFTRWPERQWLHQV